MEPRGWVQKKTMTLLIICWIDRHMENGSQKLKEGMGRVNHRAKQNKWKDEANISTGGKKILVQKNGKRLLGSLMNNIYMVKIM